MTRKRTLRREEKPAQVITDPFLPLLNREHIFPLVEKTPEIKFGMLGSHASKLADAVYSEIQASGLYVRDLSEKPQTFEPVQSKGASQNGYEQIKAGTDFARTVSGLSTLFEHISKFDRRTNSFDPRGATLVNMVSLYLGLKIVSDTRLARFSNRRRVLLEALNLYDMPVGLSAANPADVGLEQILPQHFFDSTPMEYNHEKKRFEPNVRVDIGAYNDIAHTLRFLLDKYPRDAVVQDWCEFKLAQMQRFKEALRANWLGSKQAKPAYTLSEQFVYHWSKVVKK